MSTKFLVLYIVSGLNLFLYANKVKSQDLKPIPTTAETNSEESGPLLVNNNQDIDYKEVDKLRKKFPNLVPKATLTSVIPESLNPPITTVSKLKATETPNSITTPINTK
jgi:hypothetical protein